MTAWHVGLVAGFIVGVALGFIVTIALFHVHARIEQRRPVPIDDRLEALRRLQ